MGIGAISLQEGRLVEYFNEKDVEAQDICTNMNLNLMMSFER